MIDADYIGLHSDHISRLIEPVKNKEVDSTMMMWYESLWICKILKHDIFSGMRVIPRGVFSDEKYYLSGASFSLESKINDTLYKNHLSILSFHFPEIHNPHKGWKQMLWKQPKDILKSTSALRIMQCMWYIYKQQP
jgi:hypothetical protein